MTTSFERIREAAATLREHPRADRRSIQVAAGHLDWWAAEVEAEAAELDGLAAVLFAAVYPGTLYDRVLGVRWRDAARAAQDYVAGEPTTIADDAPWWSKVTAADIEAIPRNTATIPLDASGLKGKRAKIVGTVDGEWIQWGFADGVVVTIGSDGTDRTGYFCCQTDDGCEGWIAASSLALIPDEPEHGCDGSAYCKAGTHVHGCFADTGNCDDPGDHPALIPDGVVNEGVRCGGRYSDNSRCVLDDGHDSGCRYPFIPEPTAVVPEPPVGTRLRDNRPEVMWRVHDNTPFCWQIEHGGAYGFTWAEVQEFGPLHQVWTDRNDIPIGTRYTEHDGNRCVRRAEFLRGDTTSFAPFTAVVPFAATEGTK